MSDTSQACAHEIQRVRHQYLAVYAVLVGGTALTVAMHYVHFDAMWQTVAVALSIAALKAVFVAAVFMHLWHGQRDIYKIIIGTLVFASIMLGLSTYSIFSLPDLAHYLR